MMPTDLPAAQVIAALNSRSLALFIGGDLPASLSGVPSRAELARRMAETYGGDARLSLSQQAMRLEQTGGRFAVIDFLRRQLDTAQVEPAPFHQQVAALVVQYGLSTIISTAYDDLLEKAFQKAGAPFTRVVRSSELSFTRPDRPTMIKLYGDLQAPDTPVVSERDHYLLPNQPERAGLLAEVRRAFQTQTVLFMGYDLSDADFNFILEQIAQNRFARLAYAVWPGLGESERQLWRARNIAILESGPLGILEAGAPARQPAKPPPQPPAPASPRPADQGRGDQISIGSIIASNVVTGAGAQIIVNPAPAGDPPPVSVPLVQSSLRAANYPSAYSHLLDAAAFPVVVVTVDNSQPGSQAATLRISAEIPTYGRPVVKTLQLGPGERKQAPFFPPLLPEARRSLNSHTPAGLAVKVDLLAPRPQTLWDQTEEQFTLLPKDIAMLAQRAPDGRWVELLDYLAAWVTPRAEGVQAFLSHVTARHPDRQLSGYAGVGEDEGGAARVREQARAVFIALREQAQLSFVSTQGGVSAEGDLVYQYVRYPADTLRLGGIANCVESSVLFASLLEAAGLEPLLAVVSDHVFAGWRASPGGSRLEFIETTLIASADFNAARAAAQERYEQALQRGDHQRRAFDPLGFLKLIDIAACRKRKIYPAP